MIINFHELPVPDQAAHELKWGRSNDFPPGWRELSVEEFSRSGYFHLSPELVQYRQMLSYNDGREHTGPCVSARLEFMPDGTGYAIVGEFWSKKVRFFAFGCDHAWGDATEEIRRRGIHLFSHDKVLYCTKCGHLEIRDSSD